MKESKNVKMKGEPINVLDLLYPRMHMIAYEHGCTIVESLGDQKVAFVPIPKFNEDHAIDFQLLEDLFRSDNYDKLDELVISACKKWNLEKS